MTTIESVTAALEANNIPTTGVYEALPKTTYNLVIKILHFGESILDETSVGAGVKAVAKQLAKEDGRKCVICPTTLKNVLV